LMWLLNGANGSRSVLEDLVCLADLLVVVDDGCVDSN